ncbi:MAG: ComEA family DNA-binding protein [bacterium]
MNFKSHFRFTRGQRNGIFLLLLIIVVFQLILFFVDFKTPYSVDQNAVIELNQKIDSLKNIASTTEQKIQPFNPNFISDYKGYILGMSNEEIDRLHKFRDENKWINSVKEFQNVTKVSDSLLAIISPNFKFPEWVTNNTAKTKNNPYSEEFENRPKSYEDKIDLNKATAVELKRVYGVGDKTAARIIKLRNSFSGGFIDIVQLKDVYGLSDEVIQRISDDFVVKTPRLIEKLDLNEIGQDELVTIQHIDYELAAEIIEQRTLHDGFTELTQLKKIKGFPQDKYEIIALYLYIQK